MPEYLHKGAQCSLDKSEGCKGACCLPAPFVGISTTDLDWKYTKKKDEVVDLCLFFFILSLSPAPGRKEMEEIQSCLFGFFIWLIPCLFFFLISLSPAWRTLQMGMLSGSLLWSSKTPGKVQVSLGELSVDLQRHQNSSERHQLCPYPPCRSPSGNSKRKGGKKIPPNKDPRFWLSCWHLIAPVQRCISSSRVFVSLGAFSDHKLF